MPTMPTMPTELAASWASWASWASSRASWGRPGCPGCQDASEAMVTQHAKDDRDASQDALGILVIFAGILGRPTGILGRLVNQVCTGSP